MIDKPIAYHAPDEAMAEIRARLDMDTEDGRDIENIAGHLMLLAINAERRLADYRHSVERADAQAKSLITRIDALLRATYKRKTIQRSDLEDAFRSETP